MKILLSAGHGGNDPGAVANGVREADLAREITQAQKCALQACGHEVTVRNLAVEEYRDVPNIELAGYDLLISNHLNAATRVEATGVETWYASEVSFPIAKQVQAALVAATGLANRGCKREQWQILVHAQKQGVPAILIEHGFVTNRADLACVRAKLQVSANAVARTLPPKQSSSQSGNEKVVRRWYERGTVTFMQRAPVFAQPQAGEPLVYYEAGETLYRYDECVKTTRALYLRYERRSGGSGYVYFRSVLANGAYGPSVGIVQ